MGSMTQHYKDVEKQHKKDRAAQEESNQKQMDDLAKMRPTPTNEEVQAANPSVYVRRDGHPEADHPPADPPPPVEWSKQKNKLVETVVEKELVVETKISEPEPHTAQHGGSYKTRDTKAVTKDSHK